MQNGMVLSRGVPSVGEVLDNRKPAPDHCRRRENADDRNKDNGQ